MELSFQKCSKDLDTPTSAAETENLTVLSTKWLHCPSTPLFSDMVAMPGVWLVTPVLLPMPDALNSPGRFFAASELKAIFTYCILTYDIQLEGGSMARPADRMIGSTLFPDVKAKLMFRRRSSRNSAL